MCGWQRSGYIHLASALNPKRSHAGNMRCRWERIADPESGYCDRTEIGCNRAGWVLEDSCVRAKLIDDMVTAAAAGDRGWAVVRCATVKWEAAAAAAACDGRHC